MIQNFEFPEGAHEPLLCVAPSKAYAPCGRVLLQSDVGLSIAPHKLSFILFQDKVGALALWTQDREVRPLIIANSRSVDCQLIQFLNTVTH